MEYLKELWAYLLVSAPYILFGLFVAGLVQAFLSKDKVSLWLGKKAGFGGVVKASLLGIPLPLCSCAVIPTAVTLKKSGASNGATSSFLISTPQTGVDSIALTYGLMDLPMTLLRPIAAFFSAFFAGLLQILFNEKAVEKECGCKHSEEDCCASEGSAGSCCGEEKSSESQPQSFGTKIVSGLRYAFGQLMDDMAVWMSVGLLLGALISYVVPPDFFQGLGAWQGRMMILIIGIPLYVCASASTPIAASLILKGLSPGSALLFLLVGPATNISNIAVLQKYIGKRGVVLNLVAVSLVALLLSFAVDWLYGYFAFGPPVSEEIFAHSHEEASPIAVLSSLVLVGLLVRGVYREKFRKYFS